MSGKTQKQIRKEAKLLQLDRRFIKDINSELLKNAAKLSLKKRLKLAVFIIFRLV